MSGGTFLTGLPPRPSTAPARRPTSAHPSRALPPTPAPAPTTTTSSSPPFPILSVPRPLTATPRRPQSARAFFSEPAEALLSRLDSFLIDEIGQLENMRLEEVVRERERELRRGGPKRLTRVLRLGPRRRKGAGSDSDDSDESSSSSQGSGKRKGSTDGDSVFTWATELSDGMAGSMAKQKRMFDEARYVEQRHAAFQLEVQRLQKQCKVIEESLSGVGPDDSALKEFQRQKEEDAREKAEALAREADKRPPRFPAGGKRPRSAVYRIRMNKPETFTEFRNECLDFEEKHKETLAKARAEQRALREIMRDKRDERVSLQEMEREKQKEEERKSMRAAVRGEKG